MGGSMNELKSKLIAALAGATSQAPTDTLTLAHGHNLRAVKAALMELYAAHKICCCEFTIGEAQPVVRWWPAGNLTYLKKHTRKNVK